MRGNGFVMVVLFGMIVGLGMVGGDFGVFNGHANMLCADDGGKAPENEMSAEVQKLHKECMAFYEGSILDNRDHEAEFKDNILRLQYNYKGGISGDDTRLLDKMWDKHHDARLRLLDIDKLLSNDAAMTNPANVGKARIELAILKTDVEKLARDCHNVLMKYLPASDTVEPLRLEYRKASHWFPDGLGCNVQDDLRTMYAFAETNAYTDEDKKELDDLAVRFYHGASLGGQLFALLDDDEAMAKLANIAKVRRLLAKFKKVTAGWDDTRRRLWHKVFDMATIAEHEQRLKDAAKALESADEEAEATPPK